MKLKILEVDEVNHVVQVEFHGIDQDLEDELFAEQVVEEEEVGVEVVEQVVKKANEVLEEQAPEVLTNGHV